MADADGCGIALTFATIGTTGSWKWIVRMKAEKSGPIRPMAGKWNGADIRSGTTFRAPCRVSASLTFATLSLSPAMVTCAGPLSFATTALPSGSVSLITRSTSSAGRPTIAATAPFAPRDAASRLEREHTRRDERRKFAERMARDEARAEGRRKCGDAARLDTIARAPAELGVHRLDERLQDRDAGREDRGLCDRRVVQIGGRSIKADLRQ